MIHSKNNLKTNHTCDLINLSNQPAQLNQLVSKRFHTSLNLI